LKTRELTGQIFLERLDLAHVLKQGSEACTQKGG
jgi:hypothetical protein